MQNNSRAVIIILLFLLLAGTASFYAYRTNVFGIFQAKGPTYDRNLLDMVSIGGSYDFEDLNLSRDEIRRINFAALSHRKTFPKIDMTLNSTTKRKVAKMGRMTPLNFSLVFKTNKETEVHCWERTIVRRDLVTNMVHSMKRAKTQYEHFRDLPDRTRPLRRLYL